MGQLDYPETTKEWLMRKGIMRRCSLHERDYDAMLGCPGCIEDHKRERGKQDSGKRERHGGIFDNVIWLHEDDETK